MLEKITTCVTYRSEPSAVLHLARGSRMSKREQVGLVNCDIVDCELTCFASSRDSPYFTGRVC